MHASLGPLLATAWQNPEALSMKAERKSWRYLGLLALALTAGAVRWEADLTEQRGAAGFHASGIEPDAAPLVCSRLDPGWLSECTRPDVVLAAR
jgi:hypothetical protein